MHLDKIDPFKLEIVTYLFSIPLLLFGWLVYEGIKEKINKKNPSN